MKKHSQLISIVVVFLLSIMFAALGMSQKSSERLAEDLAQEISQEMVSVSEDAFIDNSKETTLSNPDEAIVLRVIDGDTFVLESGEKVRLIGINSPEVGYCYANDATEYLKSLILGKKVYLEKDVSETDRYDRLLRYVYVDAANNDASENLNDATAGSAGENQSHQDSRIFINEDLVKKGYAEAKKYPPDIKYADKIQEAHDDAVATGLGIWGACN